MKALKAVLLALCSTVLLVFLPGAGTIKAQAATNYNIYAVDYVWMYSTGNYDPAAKTYALSGLPNAIKAGDTLTVIGKGPTDISVNIPVALSKVDYIGANGIIVYTGGITECNITDGSAVSVHGSVGTAKLYGKAAATFYDSVSEMILAYDSDVEPVCNVSSLSQVAHVSKSGAPKNNFNVYNVETGKLSIKDGALQTDAKYYSDKPAAVTNPSKDAVKYAAVFDAIYYANRYADLKAAFGYNEKKLLQHFLKYGMKEGRQANGEFNVNAYKDRYEDLRKVFGNDLPSYYQHYISYGKSENRCAI